jgi:hypothetical protein
VDSEVLSITHGLHSPAMLPSAAPMRAVIDGLWFSQPRRRLISTVTGLDITGSADPSELITGQLARPALLAGALALACADADLIVLTAHDPALARVAGDRDRVPVVQAPLNQRPGTVLPSALAAFFAAGAIDSVLPFLPGGPAVPAQAGGAGGGGVIRSGSSRAEGIADSRPAASPDQPEADRHPSAEGPGAADGLTVDGEGPVGDSAGPVEDGEGPSADAEGPDEDGGEPDAAEDSAEPAEKQAQPKTTGTQTPPRTARSQPKSKPSRRQRRA